MKTLILSLSFALFFVLLQSDLLTAKEGKDHHDHAEEESKPHQQQNSEDHDESENHSNHEDHDRHGEKEEHGDDHEEEGSSVVGPDKGIMEKSEKGFKLSPEALQSFELKTQNISGQISEYPRSTLVEIKDGKFVYRMRESWIKKISVKVIKKNKDTVILELSQFQAGDKVIVGGNGFVRVSELVTEEGVSHGHSH